MAYFRNNTVNLLNLHFAIQAIALTGGSAFFVVYLLKGGLSFQAVLTIMAAILLGRFLIRPAIIPLAVRYGLRTMLIAGTLLVSLQFLVLPMVHGLGWPLLLLCIVASVGDTLYWSTYHAYFAAMGDREHRGHQIGIREAITAMIGIVSPLMTVALLAVSGPKAAFGATGIIAVLSVLPILRTPQVQVAHEVQGAWKASLAGVFLFIPDGWIASGQMVVWQIALFESLHQSFAEFGGALAIAALAGAVGSLVLGRNIDAGHGSRAVWVTLGTVVAVIVSRAASPGHPALAIAANALASVAGCLYGPTLMTAVYNQSKGSPCTLRFHVATEGGWDIGSGGGCLAAAALLHFGAPVSAALLLPLIGVVALFVQLRRYYAKQPAVVDLVPSD